MARTQVRLHDIAVGPTKYDLPVHDGAGREVGRIVLTIRMMQKCELAVSVIAAQRCSCSPAPWRPSTAARNALFATSRRSSA